MCGSARFRGSGGVYWCELCMSDACSERVTCIIICVCIYMIRYVWYKLVDICGCG